MFIEMTLTILLSVPSLGICEAYKALRTWNVTESKIISSGKTTEAWWAEFRTSAHGQTGTIFYKIKKWEGPPFKQIPLVDFTSPVMYQLDLDRDGQYEFIFKHNHYLPACHKGKIYGKRNQS